MYVGHALIAALIGLGAGKLLGTSDERAIVVALTAGAFGLLPDVDLAYTLYAVVQKGPTDLFPTTEHVWTESWVVHRTLTHSLVVGAGIVGLAGSTAGTVSTGRQERSSISPTLNGNPSGLDSETSGSNPTRSGTLANRWPSMAAGLVATLIAVGISSLAYDAEGTLGVITVGLYIAGTIAVTVWAGRRDIPPALVVLAATIGVGLHPWGDLWMGRPPIAFYPLGSGQPLPELRFATDPTVHFLAAVLIEVGLFAAVLVAGSRMLGRTVSATISPVAIFGAGLVLALPLVPAPTFDVAYQFSFLLVGISAVAGFATWATGDQRVCLDALLRPTATMAVAMVVGVVAYGLTYVWLG